MRDGKEGLGGYDIYMARMGLDGKWQKPENLGAPINSGENEGALSLHPDGRLAIITRESGVQRNELFQIELPEKFRAYPQQELIVYVKDRLTGEPVNANLEIFQLHEDPSIRFSQWADIEGRIITSLQRHVDYGIIANSPKYIMYSSHLPADSATSRQLVIEMLPIDKTENETIVLENILFETGSADIKKESEPELKKLAWTLKTNQDMTIEIHGHTDDVGDEPSNMELSTARAGAVRKWLVEHGIPSHRMTYKGFGESKPIADNSTPEGRRKNRRTEFIIFKR
jgi:outer membrane protein OmpA-like peptidoglycan-associated protein